jgi:hypothetical protein
MKPGLGYDIKNEKSESGLTRTSKDLVGCRLHDVHNGKRW